MLSRKNTLKDFIAMAGPFKVTHMLVLSQTDDFVNLRVMRVPRGPTLSFHVRHSVIATPGVAPGSPVRSSLQVKEYTLMRHVHAMQRRPVDVTTAYLSSPLVVLNNFADSAKHLKVCACPSCRAVLPLAHRLACVVAQIVSATVQHMFPALDVANIKLAQCRRVVLLHLDKESGDIEWRHYAITAVPVGLSRRLVAAFSCSTGCTHSHAPLHTASSESCRRKSRT